MTRYVGLDVSLRETKLQRLDEAGNKAGPPQAGLGIGLIFGCQSRTEVSAT
jgi:hypothetical protein